MIKISIVLPVYNVRDYIRKCVESLLDNAHNDFELIVVNDGTPDDSIELIADLIHKDSRVVLLNKENGGVSSARNLGLSVATGDYICFVDSDDWVDSNYLDVIINDLSERPDVVVYGYYHHNSKKQTLILPPNNGVFTKDIGKAIVAFDSSGSFLNFPWNKIFSRSIIVDNNLAFKDGLAYSEDIIFNSVFLKNASSIRVSSHCYYHYRTSNYSLTNNHYYSDYRYISEQAIIARAGLYSFFNLDEKYRYILQSKSNEYYLGELANCYRPDCALSRKERESVIKHIKKQYVPCKSYTISRGSKIMALLLKTNPGFCDFVLTLLFKIKYRTLKIKSR